MTHWRWGSPYKSLQFKRFVAPVHRAQTENDKIDRNGISQGLLGWKMLRWDRSFILVYPQPKVAELGNEKPVAYWTVNPSVVKWHRRVDVTCLQALSSRNSVSSLPGISEKWKFNSLQAACSNMCRRFRASCSNNSRKIIRNLWLYAHEIRSLFFFFCYSFATNQKTALKNTLFCVKIAL